MEEIKTRFTLRAKRKWLLIVLIRQSSKIQITEIRFEGNGCTLLIEISADWPTFEG